MVGTIAAGRAGGCSDDVFDLSNPSAASAKMCYTFLNEAAGANLGLQIIMTAGNHDSASLLEAPKPMLESSDIHTVGLVEKGEDGHIDYEKLAFLIKDKTGTIKAWFLAVSFLRMGDYHQRQYYDNASTKAAAIMQDLFKSHLPCVTVKPQRTANNFFNLHKFRRTSRWDKCYWICEKLTD